MVLLLRGVNVGGHNRVPMAALRALLAGLGGTDVATYVQSGNAVLSWPGSTADLERATAQALTRELGVTVAALVRTAAELGVAVDGCPWPELDPALLHVAFLAGEADLSRVDPAGYAPERFAVGERVLYLFHAEGVQRSRLARLKVGTAMTARNWRTVLALRELAGPG